MLFIIQPNTAILEQFLSYNTIKESSFVIIARDQHDDWRLWHVIAIETCGGSTSYTCPCYMFMQFALGYWRIFPQNMTKKSTKSTPFPRRHVGIAARITVWNNEWEETASLSELMGWSGFNRSTYIVARYEQLRTHPRNISMVIKVL